MTTEPSIYLDHNSTTPIHPAVAAAISEIWSQGLLNPASQHRPGQLARRILEDSKNSILRMLGGHTRGMQTDSLIITSGGTESNNLALVGLTLARFDQYQQKHPSAARGEVQVLVSGVEHPSLIGAAEHLARLGFSVQRIPVDSNGRLVVSRLATLLQRPTMLVSVMLANNETGVIERLDEVAKIAASFDVPVHTDGVQAVGKIPVHFRELGVAALSFTAHKFRGPRGVGGLLLRHGVSLQPILFGGFQQMARRPGTEDVALVRGMEVALQLALQTPEEMTRVKQLRDQLQARLLSDDPQAVVIGGAVDRIPNTLNISFPGINRQALLMAADLAGIAISTGSACASGSSEASPVLLSMGLEQAVVDSSIRISLGTSNTAQEIELAGSRLARIIANFRHR